MSELIEKLKQEGQKHKGTDLGGLLQWAALHIADQDLALQDVTQELEIEKDERFRLNTVIHETRQKLSLLSDGLRDELPVNIKLAKDHAPHINIMAHHGVEPYAKKPRKAKE